MHTLDNTLGNTLDDTLANNRRLDQLTLALTITLIALLMASLSWRAVNLYQALDDSKATETAIQDHFQPAPQEPDPELYQALTTRDFLFGKSVDKKVTKRAKIITPPPKPKPLTKLNVKLHAIFYQGEESITVIQKHRGKTSILGIGDRLQPGVTISAIEKDFVTLNRQGHLEQVNFKPFDPNKPVSTGVPKALP
ncbi:MAG: type II secretion system protein N [Endozoicomonas sp.]